MALNDKVCVITGAASGIGQQMAVELAKQGATVVVHGRDEARAKGAVEAVKALAGPSAKVEPMVADLASLASIKKGAADVLARHPKIHLLVNNAATFNAQRRTSADGFELGFAVNNLAPYLITNTFLGALQTAGTARVVNMTMPTKTPVDFEDLQSEKGYAPMKTFEMTKGCGQYLTAELARRLNGSGVSVVCVNPGLTKSKLPSEAALPLRLVFKLFGKTPEQGAKVPLSACLDDKWKTGTFVDDKGRQANFPAFIDEAGCRKLWDVNAKLTGVA